MKDPMFYVRIKPETFTDPSMSWLASIALPDVEYPVIGIVGDKLLLVADDDQLFEVFPRKCLFAGMDDEE